MLNRFMKKILISLVVMLFLVVSFIPSSVTASTLQQAGNAANSNGDFTPKHSVGYVESTNTFEDGNVKYYLLTHDNEKASLKSVTYNGKEYPLESVTVVAEDDFNFNNLTLSNTDGTFIKPFDINNGYNNFTLFFDDGIYNDTLSTNYVSFSHENASYIGLNKNADGEPMTTISRDPRSDSNVYIDDKMERYIFHRENIYLENLKFDGKGKDMYPVGGGFGANKINKSRGEYFFTITGGDVDKGANGFVMRDVILENIGANNVESSTSLMYKSKNVAINVTYNPGQVNIENVKIRNIKTTEGFGIIENQFVDSVFYRNINIEADQANSKSYSVKVMQPTYINSSKLTYVAPENQAVVFAGEIDFASDAMQNVVYVQDHNYKHVSLPEEFQYATWNTVKGSYTRAAFEIRKALPETTDKKAVQDLKDNYWIVNANEDSPVTIEKQLEDILAVMSYANPADGANRAPQANIKLVTSTAIPSFKVPNGFVDQNVQIIAVNEYSDSYDSKDLVPVGEDAVIELPANNNVTLYNFDFHVNARLTMQEAVKGITAIASEDLKDPLENSNIVGETYPKYENYALHLPSHARVTNSHEDKTFVNCNFVVLAKELSIMDAPKNNVMLINTQHSLSASFKTGYTLNNDLIISDHPIDDTTVTWVSSDPSIATVDATGKVHAVASGNVTIYLKALDAYNNGEIEKPFDSINLIIKKLAQLVYSFDSATQGKDLPQEVLALLPPTETDLVDGTTVTPAALLQTEVAVQDGKWVFKAWDKESAVVEGLDITFTGTWEFHPAMIALNEIPTITANDKVITVGDTFDELEGVTASDKEDGDLTEHVEIVSNNVDTTKVGEYEVTYKVTDSKGASTTKTIKITVTAADPGDKPIPTGDTTNILTFAIVLMIAMGGIAVVQRRKKCVQKGK